MKKTRGITLIALIITIIVLLILAGVTLNMVFGDTGIFTKAQWAKFVTEYNTIKENIDLYVLEDQLENANKNEIAATENMQIASVIKLEKNYPVTSEKVEISEIEDTLKETIKKVESIETLTDENVSLYKVDVEKLNLDIKNDYVINTKTGELYELEGVKYKGNVYHRPDCYVNDNGEVEEEEEEVIGNEIRIQIAETKDLETILTNGEVEWSTSDESVVTVDEKGKITGIAKGEATITVSYKTEDEEITDEEESEDSGTTDEETVQTVQTFKVIVSGGIPDTFTLELEDTTISEYETKTIEATIDDIAIGTNYVEWESSDENKVKIDGKGKITGVAVGEATITCKWKEDTTKTATCKVTVQVNDTLVLDKNKMNITINQTGAIKAKYKGEDITSTATWESEDTNIVTVEKGKVKGIGLGTTNVKVTYEETTVVCEVTVKEKVSEIYTIEDLSLFASQVNAGVTFEGETVEIKADLDFKNEASYESTQSVEYTKYYTNYIAENYTTETTWTPIGTSKTIYFSGIFEGNGHKISNLYINATTVNQGLFGYANGGTIKNTIVENANITSTSYDVGGILGVGLDVTISNCKVSGNINTTGKIDNYSRTGGIVGLIGSTGGNISGCTNEATIEGSYHAKAGIVGRVTKGSITNCINKGTITGNNAYVGGIIGLAGNSTNKNYTATIDNCKNYGEVTGKCYVGGITGGLVQSSVVTNCINYETGKVVATGRNGTDYSRAEVGGIVGLVLTKGDNKIDNCKNYAEITATYNGKGGIVGNIRKGTVSNCLNTGKIVGNGGAHAGGIAGTLNYYISSSGTNAIVENCVNKGEINSTGYAVGGIAGNSAYSSQIKNSDNYGKVISTGKNADSRGCTGGIIGTQANNSNNLVENCNNYAEVDSQYYFCGGITGWVAGNSNVKNCINEGKVTNARSHTGGIVGYLGRNETASKGKGTIENCLNKADVTITGTGAYACNVGGIAGTMQYGSTITKCGNTGNINTYGYNTSSDKTSRAGGIVGTMTNAGANTITYCYNIGNVTGTYKHIGGIVGQQATTTAVIDNCYSKGTITGPANIGGIIGYKKGTVSNCYYLENSVVPTSGSKTEEGTEANSSTIDSYINAIK